MKLIWTVKFAGVTAAILLVARVVQLVRPSRAQLAANPAGAVGTFTEPLVRGGERLPHETAILAGGCFWGLEEGIRKITGVIKTTVGLLETPRQIQLTKRYAPAEPAIRRRFKWCLTRAD